MHIQHTNYPLAISKKLVSILTTEIEKSGIDTSTGVIINFRDPDYNSETGGYHPVEISVDALGKIQYITDFTYVGQGHYAELAKELDFDFTNAQFQQMGRHFQIRDGAALYKIWQANFCHYYDWKVFDVTVQAL
jgi:Protein of unknown function (DUF2787)